MENDLEFRTDDELLSAYLDGELPPDLEALLEKRLETDPLLALRLEQLSQADAALRDAYHPISAEPLPRAVLDRILAHADRPVVDAEQGASKSTNVVDLGAHRPARVPRDFAWTSALAASVMLVIGGLIGYIVASQISSPEGGLLASTGGVARGSDLHDALEMAPSGSTRDIAAGLRVTPVLTFAARDGGYCRQLAIAGSEGSAAVLACRHDDGWRVEALGFAETPALAAGAQGGPFRPASEASSAIDAAIDERIAGDPLDSASESALIERGWIPR
jgi:uncharacterized membrane protein (UPF0136 family)